MSENPAKFVAKITDNTINFGSRSKFTFRLRPDSKMEGMRNDSGVLNTTVLIREFSRGFLWPLDRNLGQQSAIYHIANHRVR
jgi:hypothetical protein